MFITKKTHDKITAALRGEIDANEKTIAYLKQEVANAKTLRDILDKLSGPYLSMTGGNSFINFSGGSMTLDLPDTVAQYVPDHFGGQCIKQEAVKVIEISAAGDITTGLTKRQPEPGFGYVLVLKGE